MTPGFFRSEEGMICAYLAGAGPGWHQRAVDLLEARVAQNVSLRITASGLSCLALAHAQAGLVDEACTSAERSAAAARQSGSARVMDRLYRVQTDLTTRYPGHTRVAELAEALR